MQKTKIEIITEIEGQKVVEKYICHYNYENIEYQDKQKTKTIIKYDQQKMELTRSGFVNYHLVHDGVSKTESKFQTLVEGEPFSMILKIQNKKYNMRKYDKILSIEIQFLREDNCLVKQIFKVEEK